MTISQPHDFALMVELLSTHRGAARLTGALAWWEMRIFELTGAWSKVLPDPAVQVAFSVISRDHAGHGETFFARLPVLRGMDRNQFLSPLTDSDAALIESAHNTADADSAINDYLGLVDDLSIPRHEHISALANPVSDGPLIRALALALADQTRAVERIRSLQTL